VSWLPQARRGTAIVGFVVFVSACLVVGPGVAAASRTPSLSHVVVEQSLAGFTLVPGAAFNGPIPKSDLDKYSDDATWQQDVGDGQLTGFVRAWSHQYKRGLAFVYWSALRMPDTSYASQFSSTMEAFVAKQTGARSIGVTGVTGAVGYRTSPPVQIGRATGYWIIFTRGTIGFFLYAVGPPRTLTTAQLVGLARQQASHRSAG
jgi:hypothetical protein